jgi:hypothetical protein
VIGSLALIPYSDAAAWHRLDLPTFTARNAHAAYETSKNEGLKITKAKSFWFLASSRDERSRWIRLNESRAGVDVDLA